MHAPFPWVARAHTYTSPSNSMSISIGCLKQQVVTGPSGETSPLPAETSTYPVDRGFQIKQRFPRYNSWPPTDELFAHSHHGFK